MSIGHNRLSRSVYEAQRATTSLTDKVSQLYRKAKFAIKHRTLNFNGIQGQHHVLHGAYVKECEFTSRDAKRSAKHLGPTMLIRVLKAAVHPDKTVTGYDEHACMKRIMKAKGNEAKIIRALGRLFNLNETTVAKYINENKEARQWVDYLIAKSQEKIKKKQHV